MTRATLGVIYYCLFYYCLEVWYLFVKFRRMDTKGNDEGDFKIVSVVFFIAD